MRRTMPPKKTHEATTKQDVEQKRKIELEAHANSSKKTKKPITPETGKSLTKKTSEELFPKDEFPTIVVPEQWYAIKRNNILPDIQIKKRSYGGRPQEVITPLVFPDKIENYSFLFSSPVVLQQFMDIAREFVVFKNPKECDFLVDVLAVLEKTIDEKRFPKEDHNPAHVNLFIDILKMWRNNARQDITSQIFFQQYIEKPLNDFCKKHKINSTEVEDIKGEIKKEMRAPIEKMSRPNQKSPETKLQEKDRIPKLLDTLYFSRYKDQPSFLERMLEVFPEKELDIDFYRDSHNLWLNLFNLTMPNRKLILGDFEATHYDSRSIARKDAKKANYWLKAISEDGGERWAADRIEYDLYQKKFPLIKNPRLVLTVILFFCINNREKEVLDSFIGSLEEETKEKITMQNQKGEPVPPLVWANLMFNNPDFAQQFIQSLYEDNSGVLKRYEYQNKEYNPLSLLQKLQKDHEEARGVKQKDPNYLIMTIAENIKEGILKSNADDKKTKEALTQLEELLFRKEPKSKSTEDRERTIKDILCVLSADADSYPKHQKHKSGKARQLDLIQQHLTREQQNRPLVRIPEKFDHIQERQFIPEVTLKITGSTEGRHVEFPALLSIVWDCLEEEQPKALSDPSKLEKIVSLLDDMCSFKDRRELVFFCWLNESMHKTLILKDSPEPTHDDISSLLKDSREPTHGDISSLLKKILNEWELSQIKAIENPEIFIKECVAPSVEEFLRKKSHEPGLKVGLIEERVKSKLQELAKQTKQVDTKDVMQKKTERLSNSLYFADCNNGRSFINRMEDIVYDSKFPKPAHTDHYLQKKCAKIFDAILEESILEKIELNERPIKHNPNKNFFCVTSINGAKLSESDSKKTSEWLKIILHNMKNRYEEHQKESKHFPDLPDNPDAVAAILRISFLHNYKGWPANVVLEKIKDKDIIKNMRIKCAEGTDMPVLIGLIPYFSYSVVSRFLEALPLEELLLERYQYKDPKTGLTSEHDVLSLWEKLADPEKYEFSEHKKSDVGKFLLDAKNKYCISLAIDEVKKILELEKQESEALEKGARPKIVAGGSGTKTLDQEMKSVKLSDTKKFKIPKFLRHKTGKYSLEKQKVQHTTIEGISIQPLQKDIKKDRDNGSEPMEH